MDSIEHIESNGEERQQYRTLNQYHSKPAPVKVICAGAGAAGLLVAFKLQSRLKNFELMIYDKNPEIGGTWYENRYPGCACDLPAHGYVYPFEPNPDWSRFYAGNDEILRYFKDFAVKYDLHRYIQLRSTIKSATWTEDDGIYHVEVEKDGEVFTDWCNVFINGSGFLNDWKWPSIPGLHSFKGVLLHTANWDRSLDWTGKTVAVLGTGSSAIQAVPQLQKTAKKVINFMRSPTWIYPAVANDLLEKTKQESDASEQARRGDEQYEYTKEDKAKFRADPAAFLEYRKQIETRLNDTYDIFFKDSEMLPGIREFITANMEARIGPGHEELKRKVIPSYFPGCRRTTPGDGYLEALVQPNVKNVYQEVDRIEANGLIDDAGELHKVDIIVCATGFKIAFTPRFTVTGTNGAVMAQEFDPEPKVYLAMTVPKFPNYFVVNGPRGNWAAGSVVVSHDIQVTYIVNCIKRMQEENIKAMEVKPGPIEQLYEHIDEWHKNSVWSDKCRSWYKNGTTDGKLWIWAGSGLHYMKTIQSIRWEHYDLRYRNNNMWAFLGNGYTLAQVNKDEKRLAPYIRNSDLDPWYID